jgi:hypothetical protein
VTERSFLRRWALRKAAARTGATPDAADEGAKPAQPQPPAATAAGSEPDERHDDEVARRLGLPDIESLTPDSDYSAFLQAAVPERIRQRALRRLWRTHPVISTPDGLTDYAEDFTDSATVVDNLKTSYRVGRGFIEDLTQAEAEATKAPPVPSSPTAGDAAPASEQPAPAEPSDPAGASEVARDRPTPEPARDG